MFIDSSARMVDGFRNSEFAFVHIESFCFGRFTFLVANCELNHRVTMINNRKDIFRAKKLNIRSPLVKYLQNIFKQFSSDNKTNTFDKFSIFFFISRISSNK